MNTIKDTNAELVDKLAKRLRAADFLYRSTRKRSAIHAFLESIYKVYWKVKKSPHVKSLKKALKVHAGLSAGGTVPLSSVLLRIASADCDRRDRNRWKCLLEAAYANKVRPKVFKRKVLDHQGVNAALAHWKNTAPSLPRNKLKPTAEWKGFNWPPLHLPLSVTARERP